MGGLNQLPIKTGLDISIPEDLILLSELDKYPKYYPKLPYKEEGYISKGSDSSIYIAKNNNDGETYVAKKRYNPATIRYL